MSTPELIAATLVATNVANVAAATPTVNSIGIAEIGRFLRPEQDFIQIFFFALIFLLSLGSLIWVGRMANSEHWKRRWKESRGDYSSPQDLSDAVATPAEHFCEALPGILLIVGLLGTFIGLGVALNDAAGVFDLPDKDEQFKQLSAVVHSLGTKFKVSTWGIMGFLLVRSVLAWGGWHEKRLIWCIERMRSETDDLRQQSEKQRRASEDRIRAEITVASRSISETTDRLGEALKPLLGAIAHNTYATQASLGKFVDTNVESMEKIANSAKDMGIASERMSSAADQVGVTAGNLQEVVEVLRDKLVGAIELMNDSFNKNLAEMSNKIEKSTGDISTTMKELGKTVGDTMGDVNTVIEKVGKSFEDNAERQGKIIDDFNHASETLSDNAEKLHAPIQELNAKLASRLAAIADIGNEIAAFGKSNIKMAKVNEEIAKLLRDLFSRIEAGEICTTSDVRRVENEISKLNSLLTELVALARTDPIASANDDRANGAAA